VLTLKEVVIEHCPGEVVRLISAGQEMLGLVVSSTVTPVSQLAELPEPSVAVKVTGVVPSG
jgi:hypothetical protein